MENQTITGTCLCGSVGYQYSGPSKVFQYCQCSRCRKYTGSAHASHVIVEPSQFQWLKGEEFTVRYEVPEARYFATTFCKKCGSSLPWLTKKGNAVVITAGTLDDDPGEKPVQCLFTASGAPWYINMSEVKHHEELPVKKK